jgi:hypothetical protein
VAGLVTVPVRLPDAFLEVEGVLGEEADVEGGAPHDAHAGSLEQRAVVDGLKCGEPFDARFDQVGEAEEILGAAFRPERSPAREGIACRTDRRVDFGCASARHLGKRALVDRGDVAECLRRGDPLPADEVKRRDVDAGNRGRGSHRPARPLLFRVTRVRGPTRVGKGPPATRLEPMAEKRASV